MPCAYQAPNLDQYCLDENFVHVCTHVHVDPLEYTPMLLLPHSWYGESGVWTGGAALTKLHRKSIICTLVIPVTIIYSKVA